MDLKRLQVDLQRFVVKENPKATMNNPDNINGKKPYLPPVKQQCSLQEICQS
jgi:hypothetical protein